MKAKVVKKFKDKHTKMIHKVGQEIKLTKERFEEINSTSYGTFLVEIAEEPKQEAQEDNNKEKNQEPKEDSNENNEDKSKGNPKETKEKKSTKK